jgi:hypothetical protein
MVAYRIGGNTHLAKRILAVDTNLLGSNAHFVSMPGMTTFLEFDIIVHLPDFSRYRGSQNWHKDAGMFVVSDSDQKRKLRALLDRWCYEYDLAMRHGKTVFVFANVEEANVVISASADEMKAGVSAFFVKQFGHIAPIPADKTKLSKGTKLVRMPSERNFASYWGEFERYSNFNGYFVDWKVERPVFKTQDGGFVVGAVIPLHKGHLVLLPPLSFPAVEPTPGAAREKQLKEREILCKKLATELCKIDSALRKDRLRTAPPSWTESQAYATKKECAVVAEISAFDSELQRIAVEKSIKHAELENLTALKDLLFEQGDLLNDAVLQALNILGFNDVKTFDDGVHEFDVMAVCPTGGRILGEVEGKDNASIDIHKMDQLARNQIDEFELLKRENYSKAVLFGNPERLLPPGDRTKDSFTKRCVTSAGRARAALVRTSDLYAPATYIRDSGDCDYASKCRAAIFAADGNVVAFPPVPEAGSNADVNVEPTSDPMSRA